MENPSTIEDLRRETSVPVVISDHQGFITFVNTSFKQTLGWTPEDVVGKPLTVIIPKSLHDAHHLGFSRFLKTGTPTLLNRRLNLKTLCKDGTELETEHFIIGERQHGDWVFGATLSPIRD
jgi:PAS domain S-box-containing protein